MLELVACQACHATCTLTGPQLQRNEKFTFCPLLTKRDPLQKQLLIRSNCDLSLNESSGLSTSTAWPCLLFQICRQCIYSHVASSAIL